MTTLAIALKDEIRRLARKEIKNQTAGTAKAVARYRREIARLKRQQQDLERKLSRFEGQISKTAAATDTESNGEQRFSARSAKSQRRRTGLSAADYAKLVGVSPLTIYNWEHGKSRPRREQFDALVALRGIGKREALARLATLSDNNGRKTKLRGRR